MHVEKIRRKLAIYAWQTGIRPIRIHEILTATSLKTLEEIWEISRLGAILPAMENAADDGVAVEKIYLGRNCSLLCFGDPTYPPQLHPIARHVPVLSVNGNIRTLFKPQFAVVGSRETFECAEKITRRLCELLITRNFIITTGGARGIDALAHRTAMALHQETIVVSASGCDKIYPAENADIFEYARRHGAVVSQFPNNASVFQHCFSARNEVIAGLSQGILVAQCRVKSGALYTARAAKKLNRPVYVAAMPGWHALTEGGLSLVKENNAKLVTNDSDLPLPIAQTPPSSAIPSLPFDAVLPGAFAPQPQTPPNTATPQCGNFYQETRPCQTPPANASPTLTQTERQILSRLKNGEKTRNQLIAQIDPCNDFDESLLDLELLGYVSQHGGRYGLIQNNIG